MDIQKAKEICEQFVEENKERPIILHEAIETVLKELEKKDKIIVLIAKVIDNYDSQNVKQYFERKVKNEN